MTPVVLFRSELDTEGELRACQKHLPTMAYRTQVPPGSLVIGRYSVLPFYGELERELRLNGSSLVNTWREHRYIADVMEWGGPHGVLDGLTPRTWPDWSRLPEGAFVLKGKTNSRKIQWNTHMFAPTRAAVPEVASRLLGDTFIREQGIVVREYIPLRTLGEGLNGLPITNEWRTFWYRDRMLARGFYWASHPEVRYRSLWTEEAEALAHEAAFRISQHATFFVLDLAQRDDGGWTVIEVNDGQMSGLSCIRAEDLYAAVAEAFRKEHPLP